MDLEKLRNYFVKVTKSAENMSNNNGNLNDLKLIKFFVEEFPAFIDRVYDEPNCQLALITMPEYNNLIATLNSLLNTSGSNNVLNFFTILL